MPSVWLAVMCSMTRCNTLSIDVEGLYTAIQQNCRALLDDVAQHVVDEFGMYLYQDGAGRHEWRENAAREFQKISEKLTDDLIEVEVGLRPGFDQDAETNVYVAQMMVALFGNHPPIETKPNLEVFKDHMLDKGKSNAQTVYPLPNFSWPDPHADNMLENVMKHLSTYFRDGVRALLRDINFYDYVYVS